MCVCAYAPRAHIHGAYSSMLVSCLYIYALFYYHFEQFNCMLSEGFSYNRYPTSSQYTTVCEQLVLKYPFLADDVTTSTGM